MDLPELLKGVHELPALQSHRDPRPFRVPHNYQQYQQTILSRSFTTFTDPSLVRSSDKDKVPAICVRGEKIEGHQNQGNSNKLSQDEEEALKQIKSPESESRINEDSFQMMNARGETNISFYDFQRTWSIEDYEVEDEEEAGEFGDTKKRPVRRLSLTGDNKTGRYHRRMIRPPSPKTKQIIRVNVVRMANS